MKHQFTLLGCGTSTGVPLPGCSCGVCLSDNPKNFRNRTSAVVRLESGQSILIDAGPDLRHQAIKHKVSHVDSVIYTHAHADHILGTDDLRAFNFTRKNRISCYGSSETLQVIKSTFSYIFSPNPTYPGGLLAQLDLHPVENDSSVEIQGINVDLFPLPHGDVVTTGFRMGELGYATDSKGLTPRAAEVLRDIPILFLDGLRWESHNTHNSIHEAIEIARQVKAKKTYLIHTTHTIDYDEVSRQLPEGIELGFDGLTVQFQS